MKKSVIPYSAQASPGQYMAARYKKSPNPLGYKSSTYPSRRVYSRHGRGNHRSAYESALMSGLA
ncbi:hypothetical protein M3625_17050 [Paenibacillus sp. MER 78]|nr:hypothetical protein [Paenibacillus sp. MER 78]